MEAVSMAKVLDGWPAVSVIIPIYNAADCIASALASVSLQTFTDYEVIVVDDGSIDANQLELAIAPWRNRIRFHRQANAGAGAARNRALFMARGRYVAFLDADDEWLPEFLERQMTVFHERPDYDLVWSDGWIRGTTALQGRRFFATTASTQSPSFRTLVQQTCTILTSSVVVRRAAVDAVRGFDARIRRGQDWDMWLRMAHNGCVMCANPQPLMWRTVRANNLSGDNVSELRRAIAVLEGIPRKLRLDTTGLGIVHDRLVYLGMQLDLELGKQALRNGDVISARAHFARSRGLRNWKVRCVDAAMRIAPGLVRHAYLRTQANATIPDITPAA
jgi:glycosyltransferase involved in cell wall biosynthesis